ncbi:hypothetical protein G9A89_006386, partial [Geosiphon pyriformis]
MSILTGSFGSLSAGLEFQSSNKNNKKKAQVNNVYSCGFFFKKPKKLEAFGTVVNLLAGPFEIESEKSSMSELSDVENLKNTVTEEMSYVDFNASKMDDMIDDTTLRKTRIRTYVLEQPPKALFFVNASNDNTAVYQVMCSGKTEFQANIIRASFTSEFSLNKAKILAICEKIIEVIIKEIPVNLLKLAIESVFFKFGNVVSIKVQLISLWQKALVKFENYYWALLYTLPVGTTAYDLSGLVNSYGGKTCFIGCNSGSYVHNKCTCRQFGHISDACLVGRNFGVCHKWVAQVAGGFLFHMVLLVFSGTGSLLSVKLLVMASNLLDNSGLANHMAFLEHSLELLSDQVSDILKRLSLVNLMPMSLPPCAHSFFVAPPLDSALNLDMIVNSVVVLSSPSLLLVNNAIPKLSLSSSKVLTTKVGGLELKMMALKISVSLVLVSLDSLCSGLGMNNPAKQKDIVCWHKDMGNLISIITETKDWWKFDFKGADVNKMFSNKNVLHRIIMLLANGIFRKKWFKNFDSVFTKVSLRFHRLELLVSKIIKASREENSVNLINSDTDSNCVYFTLSGIKKLYCASKLAEFLAAKKVNIKFAINKRIESFKMNKSHTIRSVLKHPFCKMVLNHLVVDNKLILEPDLVKFKFNKLLDVISDLSDGKAADLSSITNELWKHCDKSILNMLLVLLNLCLFCKSVLKAWKETWVLIIPKPHEWESVFMNTCPITLIETAHKIFSKIISNRISLTCSTFSVFCENNFLVLKSMMTQSSIFAVRSVVKDDMQKAYDSVSWEYLEKSLVRIKMCSRDYTNKMMTDFGLTDGYHIHDGLDQGKIFFLLCGIYFMILCYTKLRGRKVATQHILNITSEFFRINDISINNNKTVTIPINSRVSIPSLSINGLPISIAKKGESYQYLGIFLLIEGLLKSSLMKVNSDVHFFTNLVLKKAVSDKQFLYLMSAVLYFIVSYRTQFSFVPIGTCNNFANSGGILGYLFSYRFYDLQVLCWYSVHLLNSSVHIHVSASNNFLADMVHILFDCDLFLGGSLANPFQFYGGVPMSVFKLFVVFLNGRSLSPTCLSVLDSVGSLNILESQDFVSVHNHFLQIGADSLLVYTDRPLSNLGSIGCRTGAAAFFKNIDLGLGVGMSGLMLSTLVELQTIALALECVPPLCSVNLFSDSQSALDACKSELGL